jgi:hypothetical protein
LRFPLQRKQLPVMAALLDFQYELIDFMWPTWLNEPSTKMRRVWACKILFLDVIFPLDLERIIFMDADQVCARGREGKKEWKFRVLMRPSAMCFLFAVFYFVCSFC